MIYVGDLFGISVTHIKVFSLLFNDLIGLSIIRTLKCELSGLSVVAYRFSQMGGAKNVMLSSTKHHTAPPPLSKLSCAFVPFTTITKLPSFRCAFVPNNREI